MTTFNDRNLNGARNQNVLKKIEKKSILSEMLKSEYLNRAKLQDL